MTKRWCSNKIIPHFDKKTHSSKEMIVVTKDKRVFFTYALKMRWGNGEQTIHVYNGIVPYDFYKEIKSSTNPYLWMEVASISACKLELKAQNVVVQSVSQAVAQTTPVISAIQSAKTMAFQAQAPIKQNVQPEVKPEIRQETVVEKQIEKPVERIVEQQPVQQAQQTPVQQPVAQEPVQQQTVEQVSQPQVVPQEIAQNQEKLIQLLIKSDELDIKSWIKLQHEKWVPRKCIDS